MDELAFTDNDGVEVFYRRWAPNDSVRAVVLVVHGASEHSGRYARFAELLLEEQGLGDPGRKLQIFAFGDQGVLRQLQHRRIIGDFALFRPGALGEIVILATRLSDLVVDRVIAKVFSAWIRTGNRIQQIGTQWHECGAGCQPAPQVPP